MLDLLQLYSLRIIAGAGLGAIPPITHSLVADYYPPDERGSAFGWVGFAMALGGVFGAVFGANIAHEKTINNGFINIDGWRLVFFAVAIIGFLTLLLVQSIIEPEVSSHGHDDPVSTFAALSPQLPDESAHFPAVMHTRVSLCISS